MIFLVAEIKLSRDEVSEDKLCHRLKKKFLGLMLFW